MSGTSIDGSIAVAALRTDGESHIERLGGIEYCYETDVHRPFHRLMKAAELAYRRAQGIKEEARKIFDRDVAELLASVLGMAGKAEKEYKHYSGLLSNQRNDSLRLHELEELSTDHHIAALKEYLKLKKMKHKEIDLIGYHGQTLFHAPALKVSIQVGDAARMSREMKSTVVSDFRSADILAGGQGAPLAPIYHQAVMKGKALIPSVVLNLGGTANLTVISKKDEALFAFDSGPANGLLDRYIALHSEEPFDRGGAVAMGGKVDSQVLELMLKRGIVLSDGRQFFDLVPPKSLDIRDYDFAPELSILKLADALRTLSAFTAESIAAGLKFIEERGIEVPFLWIASGGGVKNLALMKEIRERIKSKLGTKFSLQTAEEVGLSNEFMEAELFAYLAVRSVRGLPISFPGTTGVNSPLLGGKCYREA